MVKKMTRREIREETFKMLFMRDFHEEDEMPRMIGNFMEVNDALSTGEEAVLAGPSIGDTSADDADFSYVDWKEEDKKYALDKVADIAGMTAQLDMLIDEAAKGGGWSCARMNKIDLTLLRLALYEMRIEGLDAGIAINEAVELAKLYGEERSPSFVNGILGKLA